MEDEARVIIILVDVVEVKAEAIEAEVEDEEVIFSLNIMETDSMIMEEDEVIIMQGHRTNQALNVIVVISSGIIATNVERIWAVRREKRLTMQKMRCHKMKYCY